MRSTVAPALGNHLWHSTLFALAAGALTLVLRKNQARARYWVWLTASLKFLLPFSLLIGLGSRLAWQGAPADANAGFYWAMEQVSQPFSRPEQPAIFPATSMQVSPGPIDLLPTLLAVAWLCGLVVVLLKWFARWQRLSAMVREAVPLHEGREVEALRRLERVAGATKPLDARLSKGSLEPGVFGIFRPILLWPHGISRRLGDAHVEAILAHELRHVQRRDNLAAALHMIVEAIFWFHPLVWWLGARLAEERECACDEQVLELGNKPSVYAESILKTCEFCVESPLACVSGVTGADLKKRIVRIMSQRSAENLSFGRKLLLAGLGAVAITLPVVLGLLHASRVQAQSAQTAPTSQPSYEVASIKPDHSNDSPALMRAMFTNDGLTAEGMTAKFLIGLAYNVKDFQVSGGPSWAESERFTVDAKIGLSEIEAFNKLPPDQRMEQRRLMLQRLLADRFQLKVSHSTKELPIYALVVAKNGPKFTQSTTAPPPGPRAAVMQGTFRGTGDAFTGNGVNMRMLANWLGIRVGRDVVDKTGLEGTYDLTMRWDADSQRLTTADPGQGPVDTPSDSSGLTIFTALKQQLGLKLEPQKGPVEIIIIDHLEKPSEN
jgi:uncharacterized protein (TIGR03435 family)